MEGFLVIGAILGLLAIAGGPSLVVFVVRAGLVLVVAFIIYAAHDITGPTQFDRCIARHIGADICSALPNGFDVDHMKPTVVPHNCNPARPTECYSDVPEGWVVDASPSAPVAITPAKRGPIHLPLADGMPARPQPEAKGWSVDDTSGPWPADDAKPGSARAQRLLERLHKAEGLEVGQ